MIIPHETITKIPKTIQDFHFIFGEASDKFLDMYKNDQDVLGAFRDFYAMLSWITFLTQNNPQEKLVIDRNNLPSVSLTDQSFIQNVDTILITFLVQGNKIGTIMVTTSQKKIIIVHTVNFVHIHSNKTPPSYIPTTE
jgi:hypothetical protein